MIRFVRPKPNNAPVRRKASKRSSARRAPLPSVSLEAEPPPPSEPTTSEEAQIVAPLEAALPEAALPEIAPPQIAPPEIDEGFAGHEEHFFSELEAFELQRATAVRDEPELSSIAPTVMDSKEAAHASNEPEGVSATRDSIALTSRRKRLRNAVIMTLCASAALLLLGITRRALPVMHAKSNATPARVSAAAAHAVASVSLPEMNYAPAPALSASAPAAIGETAKESARALVQTARSLLQAGRVRAGVSVARQALAANSSDAEPYILLAAGLQDLGDWSGAQGVFAECKAKARHGSNAECSYFLSQKH